MSRPYTGTKDGIAAGARPGLLEFVRQVERRSERRLWNNGTWSNRNMRSKKELSVHATGRAVDLSYRDMKDGRGAPGGRKIAVEWIRILLADPDRFGVEMILDYWPAPFGRGWRCDRSSWKRYKKREISGAPFGDWLHIELSPRFADDPALVRQAFRQAFREVEAE